MSMTSDVTLRRTEILVASLWLVTACGAIAGATLINPVINAPDYLATVYSNRATIISGTLGWLINDIGIVFIGLLMFPILKRRSESMALGYLSMRIFESILMIVGVFFAMVLLPLGQEFTKAGATDVNSYHAIGVVLKQVEHLFVNVLQWIFLGLGGIILTSILYQARLVPRFISIVGIVGYAVLLPAAILALFGLLDPAPGSSGSLVAVPVAIFEIILMPAWLFARGFNVSALPSMHAKTAPGSADTNN
jgi:hypothetical protein